MPNTKKDIIIPFDGIDDIDEYYDVSPSEINDSVKLFFNQNKNLIDNKILSKIGLSKSVPIFRKSRKYTKSVPIFSKSRKFDGNKKYAKNNLGILITNSSNGGTRMKPNH